VLERQPTDLTQHRSGPIRIGAQYLDRRLLNAMARVSLAQQQRQASVALANQVQTAPDTRPRGAGRARRQPGHRHCPDPWPMHRHGRLGEVGKREHRMLKIGQANERGATARRHRPSLKRTLEIDVVIKRPTLAHHRQ
jgi:hypothetical protein